MSRHTQARLEAWAQQHPGRLAAGLLQQMEDRVGRDGEAGAWAADAMPASAKSYFYRVLRVTHPNGGIRNHREMLTICTVLDHIAKGRHMQAADVLGQRLKAVEAAIVDGSWDRAQYLELVDPEGPLLAGRAEQHMSQREYDFQMRLSTRGGWSSSGQGSWSSGGGGSKGSGKDKGKGKSKGKKGFGKDAPNSPGTSR